MDREKNKRQEAREQLVTALPLRVAQSRPTYNPALPRHLYLPDRRRLLFRVQSPNILLLDAREKEVA